MRSKRVGIFGGTFDPIHMGHLIVADYVREVRGLSVVTFMPSSVSPHKQNRSVASAEDRVEMIRLAITGVPHLGVSDLEIRRGGVSYTVDTVEELRRSDPDSEITLFIGADNLPELSTWRDPERILELSTVVVLTRPGHDVSEHPLVVEGKVEVCGVPDIEVSASDIRERVRTGRSIRFRVPEVVERYIVSHGLYGTRVGGM